jgi:TrmH family RNA methyltransferase
MTATITSSSNALLKELRRLARQRTGGCVPVEGYRLVRRALDAGALLRALYSAPELFLGAGEWEVVGRVRALGIPVHQVGGAAFASVVSQGRPDGLLALVESTPIDLERLTLPTAPLVLVAEGVERPGNLGAIIRTACAAGAAAVVACDPQTDPFHPRAITASVGAVFQLPIAVGRSRDAVRWLRGHDVEIVVTSPESGTRLWQADLAGPVALVVGSEKRGVTDVWRRAADQRVTIPMPGAAMDSLNVGAAAAVALFEAVRQREARRAARP